jgi:hypothetical protein
MSTMSIITPNRPMTDTAFCTWVGQAAPGDTLEYHRGFRRSTSGSASSPPPSRRRCASWRDVRPGPSKPVSCTWCKGARG